MHGNIELQNITVIAIDELAKGTYSASTCMSNVGRITIRTVVTDIYSI